LKQLLKSILVRLLGRGHAESLRALLRHSAIHKQRPLVCEPTGGTVLVLAPHMDDEVLGCGGTIARHVHAGADVSIIFLTDGRRGGAAHDGQSESQREQARTELVATRKAEARRAATVLGVRHIHFLDAEDGRLRADARVTGELQALLERDRPHIVYLPHFLENHADHGAASDVLMAASAGAGAFNDMECRGYEVWTPLFPNIVVEIDSTMEVKKRALQCYGSQLALMDYLHTASGLNAYRSSAVGCKTARFVEAFYALPLSDYRRLHGSLRRFL
jgi:LmbE family N-acetylglucosaminyl deacetylase